MSRKFRDEELDRDGFIENMLKDVKIPKFFRVSNNFKDDSIKDIPDVISSQLRKPEIENKLKKGSMVAITVGSRGIANLQIIVAAIVSELKDRQLEPFIIPAMGSHGGATDEGQRQVLESLGITEKSTGAPVVSSMETVVIGETETGKQVRIDRHASEADGIILVGRVKPHTCFRGRYESGLMKMAAIGLGKQEGAEVCHEDGFGNMAENVEIFGKAIIQNADILFGMAIIENAFENTHALEAVPAEKIAEREPAMLERAKQLMPVIPFEEIDVLIVDEIGKNHSGDGMDPNVTGSYGSPHVDGKPDVERYVVLDLSEETHGSANGVGTAHFVTKRLYDKTDLDAAAINSLTSGLATMARMPIVMKNDKTAIAAGIFTCETADYENLKIIRIHDSSHINEMLISENLYDHCKNNNKMTIISEPFELQFDDDDNLIDFSE